MSIENGHHNKLACALTEFELLENKVRTLERELKLSAAELDKARYRLGELVKSTGREILFNRCVYTYHNGLQIKKFDGLVLEPVNVVANEGDKPAVQSHPSEHWAAPPTHNDKTETAGI